MGNEIDRAQVKDELIRMARTERDAGGDWSQYSANDRCHRYAELIAMFFGLTLP